MPKSWPILSNGSVVVGEKQTMEIRCLNLFTLSILVILAASACGKGAPEPGSVKDEALTIGRTAESLPAADEDYFKEMEARWNSRSMR